MTEKRFTLLEDTNGGLDNVLETMVKDNGKFLTHRECCDLLNALHEENQALQRHIERSTFNKIRVEDVLNCAKYDRFYDNKEAIKSIEWIADELGVDLDD